MAKRHKTLFLNTLLFAANAFASKFVTFLLVPLYTYFMSTAEYGITDMQHTVTMLITPLATLAIADAVVRFIIENHSNEGEYSFIGFLVTAFSVIIVACLTPILDLSIFGGLGNYKAWFVVAYATNAFLQLCGEIARGIGKIKIIPICAGISSCLTLLAAIVLIGCMGLKLDGYFISISIGPLVGTLVYLAKGEIGKSFLEGARSFFSYDNRLSHLKDTFKPMLQYSLPLIPNSLFWWIGTSVNRFFITGMIGIGASGLFAAAGKLPTLLNVVNSIFLQAWQLSAFQESETEHVSKFFSEVFCMLQGTMTILCSALAFTAPWIALIFLQGESYESWPMIPILLLANLMSVFNTFYGTVYTSKMQTTFVMRTTLIGAVVCFVLTPLFIIVLGVYGACVATAISQAVVFALRAHDSQKYISFPVNWRLLAVTICLLIVQSAVAALQLNACQLISGVCLFCVSALQIKEMWPMLKVGAGKLVARLRK